jgi:hypothetical protein
LAVLRGVQEFRPSTHAAVIRDVKAEIKPRQVAANEKALESIVSKLPCDVRRTILRGKVTGSFLSVLPSTVNGTELSKTEFRDALLLRYSRSPVDLQSLCDGCGKAFSVRHGLGCHTGGLMIGRHDDIQDELVYLASRAFKPSAVRDEPLINPCRSAEHLPVLEPLVRRIHQTVDGEDHGDALVHGFWDHTTDCIFDVAVIDTRLSWSPRMEYWTGKQPPCSIASPLCLLPSGRSLTLKCVDMSGLA